MNEYVLLHTIYKLVKKQNPQLTEEEIEEKVIKTTKDVVKQVLEEVGINGRPNSNTSDRL